MPQGNGGGGIDRPYLWAVSNEGIGPARVRAMRIFVDNRPVTRWNDAVRALTGEGEPTLTYSSCRPGSVPPAGAQRTLLTLPRGPRDVKYWTEAPHRFRAETCYRSVHDECWNADSEASEPEPVRACTVDEATEFRQQGLKPRARGGCRTG